MLFSYSMNFPNYNEFERKTWTERERERKKINEFFARVDFVRGCALNEIKLFRCANNVTSRVRKMLVNAWLLLSLDESNQIFGFVAAVCCDSARASLNFTTLGGGGGGVCFLVILETVSGELLYFAFHFICRLVSLDLSECVLWLNFFFQIFWSKLQ